MVSLNPIPHALVPAGSDAAQAISGPNYDEFQRDREIFELLHLNPDSVLCITMPHACAATPDGMLAEGSPEALQAARERMEQLRYGPLTRTVGDVMFLYEIEDPARPGTRQVGLGGLAASKDILTERTPDGTIVRNEGVRPKKARGRADLIQATGAIIGTVNTAVEDSGGQLRGLLEEAADSREPDFGATAEDGCRHLIWLLRESAVRARLVRGLGEEPFAYVADGNHRSAAAAMLGLDGFLAVAFPASRMGLAPYNRLVRDLPRSVNAWRTALSAAFEVTALAEAKDYQPAERHHIGLYAAGSWLRLVPRQASFDPTNAARSIDADIVQRWIFEEICGIDDPRDERLTFVGGNRDAAYLRSCVDEGEFAFGVTLPPVDMDQFVEVCRQRRMMPPKSTWFSPKIRSGLVMALLD